jgi:hypothetical protein
MNIGHLFGWSRIGSVVGLGAIAVGLALSVAPLAWTGVGIVALAFTVNAATKIHRFRELSLAPDERTRLVFVWVLLVVALVGLITDAVLGRFRAGYEGYFWRLMVAALGLLVGYRYLRRTYLPENAVPEADDTGVPAEDE